MIPGANIKTEIIQLLTPSQAWHYNVVPFKNEEEVLWFYMVKEDMDTLSELQMVLGRQVQHELTTDKNIGVLLQKNYPRSSSEQSINLEVKDNSSFVVKLIQEAKTLGSSDIHLEAQETNCRVRYRIDGKLIEKYVLKRQNFNRALNKIKIEANLDISEKRLPQDGRFSIKSGSEKYDLRVSVLPTLYGEKVVIRILGNDAKDIVLSEIGMSTNQYAKYLQGIQKLNGIVLISGPTGSGKTTTLYATLNHLNNVDNNIITIEDPIEYTLDGINQVQLKEAIGLNFPTALRSFLRQDPDIIMVGEIRDKETADMAIRASLTGHLVLSTIHTNSAVGTFNRLKDMDIPSFLIADTINLSVAQRLVRLLCSSCKKESLENAQALKRLGVIESITLYNAVGCPSCYYSGYRERKAIFEVILVDDELKGKIKTNEIHSIASLSNENGLYNSCLQLLRDGLTSFDEVYPMLIN